MSLSMSMFSLVWFGFTVEKNPYLTCQNNVSKLIIVTYSTVDDVDVDGNDGDDDDDGH